jgi:MraZ protein
MTFVGSYTHSIDAKKRVFIPSKFREDLGEEFYITRKLDSYLSLYTVEAWERLLNTLSQLPEADADELQDFLLGAAQRCVPDASGRIILDDKLLKHAKIDKNLVFVGAGRDQIKIWSEELWNEREQNYNYDNIRQKMKEFRL